MDPAVDVPAFANLSAKRLASLGKRLNRAKSTSAAETMLEKALGDWDVCVDGLWHLALHGAVSCNVSLEFASVMVDDLAVERSREVDHIAAIEVVLASITAEVPDRYVLMRGVPAPIVRLAEYLVRRDVDRARALYERLQPNAQAALALALHLEGHALPEGAAELLTAAMASQIGEPPGLGGGPGQPARLDIDRIAAELGTSAQIDEAALARISSDESWLNPMGLGGALRRGPVEGVLNMLGGFLRVNSHISRHWDVVRGHLRQRSDLPDLARALATGRWSGNIGEPSRVRSSSACPTASRTR